MQFVPLALTIGGSLLKARAANKAGNAQKKVDYGQALEEETAGAAQEIQIREAARKAIGAQVAAGSSNGFRGDTGSALDAITESQTNMVLDAMRVRREAASKARSLRASGSQAQSAGRMSAIESLIGGAAGAYGQVSDWAAVHAPYAAGASASQASSAVPQRTSYMMNG